MLSSWVSIRDTDFRYFVYICYLWYLSQGGYQHDESMLSADSSILCKSDFQLNTRMFFLSIIHQYKNFHVYTCTLILVFICKWKPFFNIFIKKKTFSIFSFFLQCLMLTQEHRHLQVPCNYCLKWNKITLIRLVNINV